MTGATAAMVAGAAMAAGVARLVGRVDGAGVAAGLAGGAAVVGVVLVAAGVLSAGVGSTVSPGATVFTGKGVAAVSGSVVLDEDAGSEGANTAWPSTGRVCTWIRLAPRAITATPSTAIAAHKGRELKWLDRPAGRV
jgi:hypothetical protein